MLMQKLVMLTNKILNIYIFMAIFYQFDYNYFSNKITTYSHVLYQDTLLVFLYLLFI